MTKIEARIIAGSISPQGHPIATWIATFPRHILAELNTHRMLSRNSASSRAIPFKKMVEMVRTNPFIPIKWMKDHTGMQGNEYLEGTDALVAKDCWLTARNRAIEWAMQLNTAGVTKQICNRLLEPFMWHTAIITATEIENFTALRDDPATEIHFQELAHQMLTTWNEYDFKPLKAGEWHMPFGDQIEDIRLLEWNIRSDDYSIKGHLDPVFDFDNQAHYDKWAIEQRLKIATARCARISYGTFEGKDDYEADIKLHDRLAASGHWSPMEHCAKAMNYDEFGSILHRRGLERGWCGNFRGWIQYRKLFPNENKKDMRVKQHGI